MLTEALTVRDGPSGTRGFTSLHTRRRPESRVAQRHYTWAIDSVTPGLSDRGA